MKFIEIPLPPYLPARWPNVYAGRIAKVAALGTRDLRSEYIKKNGSWGLLKKWLASFSGEKCWYCEWKSTRAPLDVDHFRPKLGVTVDDVELTGHDGYYWLAYEWWNFRLSCQRCNRPEKEEAEKLYGKANEFPIQNEANRCRLPVGSLSNETPRLLDPCVESDCVLLAHGIDGEVKPAVLDEKIWEYQRARYTIDRLGLNSWNTPEDRREKWQDISILLESATNNRDERIVSRLKKYLSPDQEYSSFFRSAIGTHRDKAWVEELL